MDQHMIYRGFRCYLRQNCLRGAPLLCQGRAAFPRWPSRGREGEGRDRT